jgi:autotransporter-associated beta strand protein
VQTINLNLSLSAPQQFSATNGGLVVTGTIATNNNPLAVSGSSDVLLAGGITGGGSVTKLGAGTLTLSGSNNYTGGTTVNGGTLVVSSSVLGPVVVNNSATLAGHGSVAGVVTVNSGGFLSPGDGPTSTASITLGSVMLISGAQTNIKLAGTTPGSQYDQLQVTGSASLAGTLAVSLINGFTPSAGETFDILVNSTPSGTFDSLELPNLSGPLSWDASQLYTNGSLSVVETFLLGDLNRDGRFDVADILAMEQALIDLPAYQASNGLSAAQLLLVGDMDGDGEVTNADLQGLLNLLANGGGSGSLTAVPEPASWALLVFGGVVLMLILVRSQ